MVEIPKGSSIKYEINPKSRGISVHRILFPAMFYPCNYGFIPQTKEEQAHDDGAADPIDVFILGNYSLLPNSVISCRPVGVLLSEDQDGIDSKIIAVPSLHIYRYRSGTISEYCSLYPFLKYRSSISLSCCFPLIFSRFFLRVSSRELMFKIVFLESP
ncbi:MAG: inorganic diphosphatase [Candidatus Nitrosopolaris sp.]